MENITSMTTSRLDESPYVQPFRLSYTQNEEPKVWDCLKVHDSVAILLHHTERDTFIFVRQFRPAVYINVARERDLCTGIPGHVDTGKLPGRVGVTYELCAGIVDKSASLAEIAKTEILEECGYDVPVENIEKITTCRSGVGVSGSKQTLFYAKVTEKMKKTAGGGNKDEGELIEMSEVPVKDSLQFTMDETIERPVGMLFAIMWYHNWKTAGNSLYPQNHHSMNA